MKCFINNVETLHSLRFSRSLDSYRIKFPKNPETVSHDHRTYTHIATYSQGLSSEKKNDLLLKTALITALTFGFFLISDEIRDDWSTIFSGKRVLKIYVEEGVANKVNVRWREFFPQARDRFQNPSVSALNPVVSIESEKKPILISWQMVWDGSLNGLPYNAFTDLIYFQNQFFCCFRESIHPQQGDNGKIRILASKDSFTWKSVADLSLNGYDLRDPKLSITPGGRLLLNLGATLWTNDWKTETLNSAVSFSNDGINWGPVQVLPYTGQWLWRVTWNQNIAYAMAYSFAQPSGFQMQLMSSPDGILYSTINQFTIPGNPTEATIRFLPDNTMVGLVRTSPGVIGVSPPPYTQWTWYQTTAELGGPDFLILNNGEMWASSRGFKGQKEKCVLASMSQDSYQPVITLPSKGDSGYTGMVEKDGKLYVSYYTSEIGKAAIYLATVQLPKNQV